MYSAFFFLSRPAKLFIGCRRILTAVKIYILRTIMGTINLVSLIFLFIILNIWNINHFVACTYLFKTNKQNYNYIHSSEYVEYSNLQVNVRTCIAMISASLTFFLKMTNHVGYTLKLEPITVVITFLTIDPTLSFNFET